MEISCINLELLRQELILEGVIKLDKNHPPSESKLAIAKALGKIDLVEMTDTPPTLSDLGVQTITPEYIGYKESLTFLQRAREVSEQSYCWISRVGSIVVDRGSEVRSGFNRPPTPGDFCQNLGVDIKTIMSLLKTGERLDFCQTIHDVEVIVAEAARDGYSLKGKNWYLSLEPCDRCANALVVTEARSVYFGLDPIRGRYYSPVGLRKLARANIPTYFIDEQ